MHRFLLRQIRRLFGDVQSLPAQLRPLFDAISEFYDQADTDRAMIERSLDIASQEMLEKNRALVSELKGRQAAELQVQRLVNYDELTGLANRNLLADRLSQAVAGAQRQSTKFAVLMLGLDHFKLINDSLGYGIGNELLKITSQRLASCIRGSDTVARLSGDEFAMILLDSPESTPAPNPHSTIACDAIESHLVEVLRRILKAVSESVVLSGRELQVTCSIGLAIYPQDGIEGGTLLKNADAAMNSAKQLGRNAFQFYTSDLSTRIESRLELQGQLRAAVERNEFVLHYQPQLDLRTGKIIGVEALVRWNHPEMGMVPPILFIGLAEETGLIIPIGAWVIRTACKQCKEWQDGGLGKLRMAVNLSVRQFAQPDLVEYIASVLDETGLDPQSLEIELTESLVMNNVEQSIEILQRLKQLGLQMSIDDFGTGYSSLAYLKRFPIDLLKIDQSFVRDILGADDAAIVKAIISMAHSLGISVIAEGVETEAQCEFLKLNMCDEIQGYLFSRPIDADKLSELLRIDKRLPDNLLRFEEKKRRLLLVDDEPNIMRALVRLFRGKNIEILTANSGQEGLDILEKHSVDVIISDQRMPHMTGVEFFGIVKDRYPDTIRIILSGYTELQSVTEAVNKGAIYKFLTKPWEDELLLSHIEDAFRHREMEDENSRLNLEVRSTNQELAKANRRLEGLLDLQQQQSKRDEITLDIVREALQKIPLAVVAIDDDDLIVFVNDAANSLFGGSAGLLGNDVNRVIPAVKRACAGNNEENFSFELQGRLYDVASRAMGRQSQSQGRVMIFRLVEHEYEYQKLKN